VPTPFYDADANVLFGLNLSPKAALNHKEKSPITLAYDPSRTKCYQSIILVNNDSPFIKNQH